MRQFETRPSEEWLPWKGGVFNPAMIRPTNRSSECEREFGISSGHGFSRAEWSQVFMGFNP